MINYVYILFNNNNNSKFYVGISKDLKKRLKQHKKAKLPHRNKQYKLIYFEGFVNKKDAVQREKYFKTTKGRRSLKLMLKYTLSKLPA